MPKSLSSFLEDCRREIPNEVVHVEREVDPAHYDVSAIIKHLGAAGSTRCSSSTGRATCTAG